MDCDGIVSADKYNLLDEPTTYLDIGHQLEVLELLSKLNKEEQQTIVMVYMILIMLHVIVIGSLL